MVAQQYHAGVINDRSVRPGGNAIGPGVAGEIAKISASAALSAESEGGAGPVDAMLAFVVAGVCNNTSRKQKMNKEARVFLSKCCAFFSRAALCSAEGWT